MNVSTAIDVIRMLYGPPIETISACLRGFLIADEGHELVIADYSAIEARVLAWLAGDFDTLEIFRGDGKVYEHAAAGIYGVDMDEIDEDDPRRQIGKVSVLALGYQGGVKAFQSMAKAYGVKVTDEEADEIKKLWRETHQAVKQFWKDIEKAAIQAAMNPGDITACGADGRVKFKRVGSHLLCQLPSGRALTYPFVQVRRKIVDIPGYKPWETDEMTCGVYKSGAWRRRGQYGGLLTENVVQAVARDLLTSAMLRLDALGYRIVLHVHDEIVVEVPVGQDDSDVRRVEQIMEDSPAWADGLPVKVKGWRSKRYGK